MERKSIPNWPRANSPTRTRCSRRHGRSDEIYDLRFTIYDLDNLRAAFRGSSARKSSIINHQSSMRRVMGAWWPPRSSKPLSARFTGRGVFNPLPLRHFVCRMAHF
jgi:hypothetical protein